MTCLLETNSTESHFIAHHRQSDGEIQTLDQHLFQTSKIAAAITEKIGLRDLGELLGLLHDLGKHSSAFQTYIGSATGRIDPDADDFVDAKGLKGKIDHSTAGAQWVWQRFRGYGKKGKLCGQIVALCLASHHSGLIDVLKPDGSNGFDDRLGKADDKTHLNESIEVASKQLINRLEALADKPLLQRLLQKIETIYSGGQRSETIRHFHLGLLTRILFSALIDADRINSADFENPENVTRRHQMAVDWNIPAERMELAIEQLPVRNSIDEIRRVISAQCHKRAFEEQGIYTLTVPTGGGKTYASLRYALHHAKYHQLDHIIYVIPFTSIIEQNAEEIRKIVEQEGDQVPWVLEHHSSLEPEQQNWHSKLAAENWNAPIVLTTMVQFLETLFSGGTRGARRMHQLANSLIIFDEIQTLPVNCTHLFCNAINFLTQYTHTTVLLCTATQPLLDRLKSPEKGALTIPKHHELVSDVSELFEQLKRVSLKNLFRPKGWRADEIKTLMLEQLSEQGNCLVIVNTKGWASSLYQLCRAEVSGNELFHLSTHQCPAHRKRILDKIRDRLDLGEPVLCISTQLMEAGVDVDFNAVIRFAAGLDSIAQSAGRCNRNGRLDQATVYIVNPDHEPIQQLNDIREGRDQALRILGEYAEEQLLSPDVMSKYFEYYFYNRAAEMAYPLKASQAGQPDTLLNLLADNPKNIAAVRDMSLRQSFMSAGSAFKAIDAPTTAVIVPYLEGIELIAELCGIAIEYDPQRYRQLLKQAQKFSVNLFPHVMDSLQEKRAIHEIQPGEGIFYLDPLYYSNEFGLSTEGSASQPFLHC